MYNNYFLFEKQIKEIKPRLLGQSIQQVFTYRKNELVLETANGTPLHLLAGIGARNPYFLLREARPPRQPKFNIFDSLQGQEILDIFIIPFDKKIILTLSESTLSFIFYGKQPNCLIHNQSGQLIDTFKEYFDAEPQIRNQPHDFRKTSFKLFLALIRETGIKTVGPFLKHQFAAINRNLLREILFRAEIDERERLDSLDEAGVSQLHHVLNAISREMEDNRTYIYYKNKLIKRISLIRLFHLEPEEGIQRTEYDSVNEAWKRYINEKNQQQEFDRLFQSCSEALNKRLNYLERSVEKIKAHENLEKKKEEADLKGNLLLTHKNEIKKGATQVVLPNIFDESQEKITIKLNRKKSVVENANHYFNKYKNIKKQKLILDIKKNTFYDELEKTKAMLDKLKTINALSKLNQLYNELVEMRLVQSEQSGSDKNKKLAYSFNRLILDKAWDLYIGRSGENNDLLTFSFANKWDIWFHAQGVPGSHVIIRRPKKEVYPPRKVMEQAAQIAAANSKAKHSGTVGVIYTEVRYVSRIRKASPGTVKVKNEKVMFVKPLNLN